VKTPHEIRVAVFGNGFAREVILPCLRLVEGIRLAGIASPNQERARATAEAFGIERVAADHREILERARPDLVFVVTPPHRHAEMALDALDAGCHVVCEKPTALTAAESARMLAAAREARGRLALVDHELRFDTKRAALRDLVAAGSLGAIQHATYTVHSVRRRNPEAPWTWWSDAAQGGGTLGALGSHAVDALRALLGEVAEARGVLRTFTKERRDPATGAMRPVTSDDFAAAWLRFESGAIGTILLSTVEGERLHRLTVAGTEGAACWNEQSPLRALFGNEARPERWREIPVENDLLQSETAGLPDTDWSQAFLRLARAVAKAIREGSGSVPGAPTFEDGHRNQLVLDAIRESAGKDTWIPVRET
jgi:predicted dehydrogenase